ncbi:MAG TPA: hypothetical protein VGB92_02435 [Longimicrobium sp.]|jgi:hypothetical protein
MQQSGSGGAGNQGNMQKIGEGLGGMLGQMADNAMSMFGPMLNNMGGWWAQAGNAQQGGGGSVHASFNSEADNRCRTHFEAQGRAQGVGQASTGGHVGGVTGSMSGGGASGSMHASGSTAGGDHSGGISAQGSTQGRARSYEEVRPLYQFGHMAGQNPDYQGRAFHQVEGELQSHWGSEQSQQHGSWPDVRGYVEFGYSGHSSGGSSSGGASGGTGGMNASGSTGGASGSAGGGGGGFHASGSIDTTGGSGGTGNTGT